MSKYLGFSEKYIREFCGTLTDRYSGRTNGNRVICLGTKGYFHIISGAMAFFVTARPDGTLGVNKFDKITETDLEDGVLYFANSNSEFGKYNLKVGEIRPQTVISRRVHL